MSLRVHKAQGQAIVIDRGRQHAQRAGLSQGGPMDEYSYLWANRLLGNPQHAAMLEITLGNMRFEVLHSTTMAITGGAIPVHCNGEPVAPWSRFTVAKGDVLEVGFYRGQGTRLYLATLGGFAAPLFYHSRSCVLREHLGGHAEGRAVQAGDTLQSQHQQTLPTQLVPHALRKLPTNRQRIRFIPSYQHACFATAAHTQFVQAPYQLTPAIDRMGFRLHGQALVVPEQELRSEGIALGSIQINHEGQPMVLMSDRQSIGGYAKLGVVYRVDLGLLAQMAPGQQVHFAQGCLGEAWQLQQQREQFFAHCPFTCNVGNKAL